MLFENLSKPANEMFVNTNSLIQKSKTGEGQKQLMILNSFTVELCSGPNLGGDLIKVMILSL